MILIFQAFSRFKRLFGIALGCVLLAAGMTWISPAAAEETSGRFVLEASSLEAFAAKTKADGETTDVDGFFSLLWSEKSKVDSSKKSWPDGYASNQRISFRGKASTKLNAVRFSTDSSATVKIWWAQRAEDDWEIAILDDRGNVVTQTHGKYAKDQPYYSELTLDKAGTYYLGGLSGGNYLFKIEVAVRKTWDTVPPPVITDIKPAEGDPGILEVAVQSQVSFDGADSVAVQMITPEGLIAEMQYSTEEKDKHIFTFTPADSARYTFVAVAEREEERDYKSGRSAAYDFCLPEGKTAVKIPTVVFVSPDGTGNGTKEDPASIYAAVQRAVPGQTIILLDGVYLMKEGLVIERGIDGTPEYPISLTAAPDAAEPPVLDCGGEGEGLILAGDHWHLAGFSVTGSGNGKRGIHVCGNDNVLEGMTTYRNGNTGIQISRYQKTDGKKEWPSYNLVLNCTSYLNADSDYNDADGFAAKITCGEGNIFDGCIAYYNADDGFDLYAKTETGRIGQVVIRNCVAYKNGYLLDEKGEEIKAGDGSGFKMGGESLSGRHMLINSIAFANKSRGIDSNSCPDIQVERATSFDNGYYNVQLYTKYAKQTDYAISGVLSVRRFSEAKDTFDFEGEQDITKVYGASNYYISKGVSVNSEGKEAQENWFFSMDTDAAIHGGITRNADGSINMGGFLELTDEAPADTGARITENAGR